MSQPLQKRSRLPRSPHNPDTKAAAAGYQAHRHKISESSNPPDPSAHETDAPDTPEKKKKKKKKNKAYHYKKRDFTRSYEKSLDYAKDLNKFGLPVLSSEEIQAYESTQDRDKRAELIKIMSKYRLAGQGNDRVWIFDVDDFAKRRGGAETGWIDRTATELDLKNANFMFLRDGTSYGYRVVNGEKELVFAVRFTPYKDMSTNEVDDVRRLAKHFQNTFRFFNWIKNNGAHLKGGRHGDFAAEGWTAGYDKDFRTYRVKEEAKIKKGTAAWDERNREIAEHTGEDEMKFVSRYYEDSFEKLCPAARKMNLKWMEDNCMPEFGAKTWDPEEHSNEISASNLTVTRNDFSNTVHRDNDASPFSFGIWFLATDEGDIITDDATTRNAVEGGQFFLPEFKIAIDFGKCTGRVDMMWRGQKDPHATAHSTTQSGLTRIGTSIQGARRLLQKVKKTGEDRLKRQAKKRQRTQENKEE